MIKCKLDNVICVTSTTLLKIFSLKGYAYSNAYDLIVRTLWRGSFMIFWAILATYKNTFKLKETLKQ